MQYLLPIKSTASVSKAVTHPSKEIDFTCYNNGLLPKFLNFRLYTTKYSSSHLYREFQRKLLEKEIKFKKSQVRVLQNKIKRSSL